MRLAPSSEVPPNLNAIISELLALAAVRASMTSTAATAPPNRGLKSPSADISVCTFSGLMVRLHFCFRLERLEGGFKEETHRQIASGGGLETFFSWLAVPRAGSGNGRLRRSRRSSRQRHSRDRNSLSGGENHMRGEM